MKNDLCYIQKEMKETQYNTMENISYDINGVYDKSFEENNKLITDIEKLIENNNDKKDILINIIKHYICNYSDMLEHIISNAIIESRYNNE